MCSIEKKPSDLIGISLSYIGIYLILNFYLMLMILANNLGILFLNKYLSSSSKVLELHVTELGNCGPCFMF